ncbi:MAG TPA: 16S rRNA (cytidine(1402)-2'-O)-methyltransferase [Candidatus Limnocylindrales bacterium]
MSPGNPASARGTLYVVATPIGNLGDVTQRALDVLSAVPLVAAEDTRVTGRLLARFGIRVRTLSFNARNAHGRLPELLDHLRGGADLAVVTDAGTPGVSDPGEDLVRAWAAEDGLVEAIPGASAVTVAVAVSGIAGPRWSFEGFLPRGGRERRDRLARIAADERGSVVFEAPTRIGATLRDLAAVCGDARPAAVCRELTKLHEQVVRAPFGRLAEMITSGAIPARGEFVVVVGAAAQAKPAPDLVGARAEVERLVADGIARGEAARRVAAATGVARRSLYGRPGSGSEGRDDDR